MRIHIRILPDVFVAVSTALIVNDWIVFIVRWMSTLTYDVVEHSRQIKNKLVQQSLVFCT